MNSKQQRIAKRRYPHHVKIEFPYSVKIGRPDNIPNINTWLEKNTRGSCRLAHGSWSIMEFSNEQDAIMFGLVFA